MTTCNTKGKTPVSFMTLCVYESHWSAKLLSSLFKLKHGFKAHVSDKSMNHIIMAKKDWKVYVCRYAERYDCACDIVICETCYNKNNKTRLKHSTNINTQKLHDMFYPLFNEHTGETWCVENPVEYHKIQYLKKSDSAYIWIPSWRGKKRNELQKQTTGKYESITFPSDFCKKCSMKFEVQGVR